MSSDLIDRQAAIEALCAACGKACDKSKFVYNAPQDEQVILCPEHYSLCTLPSAGPKTGKWERHYSRPNVYADLLWHCSECGYRSSDNWADKFNFCPNCGSYNGGENEI